MLIVLFYLICVGFVDYCCFFIEFVNYCLSSCILLDLCWFCGLLLLLMDLHIIVLIVVFCLICVGFCNSKPCTSLKFKSGQECNSFYRLKPHTSLKSPLFHSQKLHLAHPYNSNLLRFLFFQNICTLHTPEVQILSGFCRPTWAH